MSVYIQPVDLGGTGDAERAAKGKFPLKYLKPFQTVEVKPGDNFFELQLTSDP